MEPSMMCGRCGQFIGMGPCAKCDCPECASDDNVAGQKCADCASRAKPRRK